MLNFLLRECSDSKMIYGSLQVKGIWDVNAVKVAVTKAKAEVAKDNDDWSLYDLVAHLPKDWDVDLMTFDADLYV